MISSRILRGERNVGEIDAAMGIRQPALNPQFMEPCRDELVKTRRASSQIWYQLAGQKVCLCARNIETILGDEANVEHLLGSNVSNNEQLNANEPQSGVAAFARII